MVLATLPQSSFSSRFSWASASFFRAYLIPSRVCVCVCVCIRNNSRDRRFSYRTDIHFASLRLFYYYYCSSRCRIIWTHFCIWDGIYLRSGMNEMLYLRRKSSTFILRLIASLNCVHFPQSIPKLYFPHKQGKTRAKQHEKFILSTHQPIFIEYTLWFPTS